MAIEETVERQDSGSGERQIVPFCMCESYLRSTERAALAGARWLGRDDQESAEEAAFSGMQGALSDFPITGRVVIGAGHFAAGSALTRPLGAGGGEGDLALDPLEGRRVV